MNEDSTEDDRKEEIRVGLKNALDRKETLERAKLSLINAGYDPKVVDVVLTELGDIPEKTTFEKIEKTKFKKIKPIENKKEKVEKIKKLPKTTEVRPKKKKVAIYVIISIIILVLAALLGLYWDKIVGMF